MYQLEQLKPADVFYYFRQLASIPHGSGNCRAASEWLCSFAKEHELEWIQDESLNVIIRKNASEGYENAAPVILQGHMDMVCEKNPDCETDFSRDGLKLAVDGDWLYAEGTTLGGDDGIAVAMILAILADSGRKHPPIEAVFTVDEEIGLLGAGSLDSSLLKGKRMINIDSDKEGILTAGCGGGVDVDICLPVQTETVSGTRCILKIGGLTGGHSGMEINKERAGASVLMGRILYDLQKRVDFRLVSMNGGLKTNVITRECCAEILLADEKNAPAEGEKDADAAILSRLADAVKKIESELCSEYRNTDPLLFLSLVPAESSRRDSSDFCQAFTKDSQNRLLTWMMTAPFGVIHRSTDIPELVETSLNPGVVQTCENHVRIRYCVRSSVETRKRHLCDRLTLLAGAVGGSISFSGNYPGWEFNKDSSLLHTCADVFREVYHKDPIVTATHAGLECGLFSGKIGEGFEAVSIGPDLIDIHTPDERLSISSTGRVYAYLCRVLEMM